MNPTIYVLCPFAETSELYRPWLDQVSRPLTVIRDGVKDWLPPDDAGLVVTHMHYRADALHVLRNTLQTNRVPVLILADGILEYRNTWEHPELPDGAMFQPLFGHKLACLGRGQARWVESWGNAGRCEVVGLPRLDGRERLLPRSDRSSFRVMVATANTPAFDDQQERRVGQSLEAIRRWAEQHATVNGRTLEITWRVNESLTRALSLPGAGPGDRQPLDQALANVDAVITTPSTLFLESCLQGRPTALLDFLNAPSYVPAAWQITAESQIGGVLAELAAPPPGKTQFQQAILDDQLEHHTPATPRLLALIEAMVVAGERKTADESPLTFPPAILPETATSVPASPLDLAAHFPDNERFAIEDRARLQVEFDATYKRLSDLELKLTSRENQVEKIRARNQILRARVHQLHDRVKKLRKQLELETPTADPDPPRTQE